MRISNFSLEKGSSLVTEHVMFFYSEDLDSEDSIHGHQQNPPNKTSETINDPAALDSASVFLRRQEGSRLQRILCAIISL